MSGQSLVERDWARWPVERILLLSSFLPTRLRDPWRVFAFNASLVGADNEIWKLYADCCASNAEHG